MAAIWTEADGITSLGGGFDTSEASFGGDVIVGRLLRPTKDEAFRWTESDGVVGLGALRSDGRFHSYALSVSADGSVVVGKSDTELARNEAFILDAYTGMRHLGDVLSIDLGLDLAGWTLYEATSVSADGNTVVGIGSKPLGKAEAWIAVIPEPSTALLLATGLLGLAIRRRTH